MVALSSPRLPFAVAAAVHEYIEVFYNRRRRHTTNGGKAPATYEALAEQQLTQAA